MKLDFNTAIARNIEQAGQHLWGIFDPDGEKPAFCYSVGNALVGLPELLLIANMPQHFQGRILNEIAEHQRQTGKPLEEGLLDIDWTFPFKIRKCTDAAKAKFTVQTGHYLGREDYDLLQVMICDPEGKYPGEEGVQPEYDYPQP